MSAPRPSGARWVALGILTSRIFGLIRQKAFSWFFGVGPHTDVLQNALRLPNVLQNLLGEQSLSAAFIPIYSRMLAEGRREDAGRFAGAIFALMLTVVSIAVVAGMLAAPLIVTISTPGFLDDAEQVARGTLAIDRFALTVRVVRILFPMTGLLVLSAWCLGVFNSHRRFLLPYVAPVMWNTSVITVLVAVGWRSGFLTAPTKAGLPELEGWLFATAWGGLLGGVLQFAVQLPLVLRLMEGFRIRLSLKVPGVREALRTFGPALLGRGVVQIGQYINMILSSFLRAGAPAALNFAVVLINLPLAAFGMSVAAAELPELSRADPKNARAEIEPRLDRALRQASFVIFPSVVGYLLFGYLVVGLLFLGGQFAAEDQWLVYALVFGYSLGLPATAMSRILQNTFFALRDTRTPAVIALVRLAGGAALGGLLMVVFDRFSVTGIFGVDTPGKELYLGALGLTLGASVGDGCEIILLLWRLRRRLPGLRLPLRAVARFPVEAVVFALPSLAVWALLPPVSVFVQAIAVLPWYPLLYLGFAWWRRSPELELWLGRLRRGRGE